MEEDRACEMLYTQLSAARGRFRECLAGADRTQGKLPTERLGEKGLFPRRMAPQEVVRRVQEFCNRFLNGDECCRRKNG